MPAVLIFLIAFAVAFALFHGDLDAFLRILMSIILVR
jgi:uncharacterized membrane protein